MNNYADIINGVSKFIEPSDEEDAFWEIYELCKYAEEMNPKISRTQIVNLGTPFTNTLSIRSLVNYFAILSHMNCSLSGCYVLKLLLNIDHSCGARLLKYIRGVEGTAEEQSMAATAFGINRYKFSDPVPADKFSKMLHNINDLGKVNVCEI